MKKTIQCQRTQGIELVREGTVAFFATVQMEGDRQVLIDEYSLDAQKARIFAYQTR